jgi:hypothetical protein
MISNLADYFEVTSSVITKKEEFWFRGQRDSSWTLTPSALRITDRKKRQAALDLMRDFRRIAEIKLDRPPSIEENLKWLQLAQHYGLPTRLLDWTESAMFALYFACLQHRNGEPEADGIVFLFNHLHLTDLRDSTKKTSMDAHLDESLISGYLKATASRRKNGLQTIAIKPVWNSQRLMMQRGVFTLHGTRRFDLDDSQARSLVGIPILHEHKSQLRDELSRIGIDQMALFPELEHACEALKRKVDL